LTYNNFVIAQFVIALYMITYLFIYYYSLPLCFITILHFVSSGIHHVHDCLTILNGFTQLYDVVAWKQQYQYGVI